LKIFKVLKVRWESSYSNYYVVVVVVVAVVVVVIIVVVIRGFVYVLFWPVHLNDKNVSSREDTFLSWHLLSSGLRGRRRTYLTILNRTWSADSKMVR
jgi:hypothetical protein